MSDTPTQLVPSAATTVAADNDRTPLPAGNVAATGRGWPAIPGYEILGELGTGGMGRVYRARQASLNRVVALKTIVVGGEGRDDLVRRFSREAETVARLHHPNVVQVYEFGEHDGLPWFAMELVQGVDLARKLGGTPVAAHSAAWLIEILARAMHAVHVEGQVLHRDLKPQNVMLLQDGPDTPLDQCRPMITDFGLAKLLDAQGGQTPSEAMVGTPSYMAPELAKMGLAGRLEPTVDVYALGAILYECLTGRPPFRAETPVQTVLQVLETEPVAPRQLQPGVPRDLETICLKCLEKLARRRYPTALELADDLQRFLASEPIRARPAGVVERLWRWSRRNPRVALLAGALVLVVAFGFAGVTWQWRQAKVNYERAERNLGQAREVIWGMGQLGMGYGADEGLAASPGLQPLRRDMLHKARDYYQTFLSQHSNDPNRQRDLAVSCQWVGIAASESGKLDEARDAYRQAGALFQTLVAEHPEVQAYRTWLASHHLYTGLIQCRTGQLDEALESQRQATAIWEQLVRERPDETQYRRNLALACWATGMIYMERSQPANAVPCYERAREIQRGLLSKDETSKDFRQRLADSSAGLGGLYQLAGQPDKTLLFLEEVHELRRRLVDKHPVDIWCQHDLARSELDLGEFHRAQDHQKEARNALESARQRLKQLSRDDPDIHDFQRNLAEASVHLGNLEREAGAFAEALSLLNQARGICQELLQDNPDVTQSQVVLADSYTGMGWVQRAARQPEKALAYLQEARASWEKLRRDHPGVPRFRSGLAEVYREIGDLQLAGGQPQAARQSYDQARQLQEELVRECRDIPSFARNLDRTKQAIDRCGTGQSTEGLARP
jgi:tetratricopeptide (TPR) repeat protein